MNERLLEYIETSFLKELLNNKDITDISFNGEDIYYKDNSIGRVKSNITLNPKEPYDFIRQIANLSDSQFSLTNPILDVSVDRYRISATHLSMTRKNREPVVNFSIRIGYNELRIRDDDSFSHPFVMTLLILAIENKMSIAISGKTGTGKTEFQKYLISKMEDNTRLIIIDNINELETDYFTKNLDSQTWLLLNNNVSKLTFDDLIKSALRSNPDWIIVGESRGKEMLSILNSAMSGHPTITTLHAKDAPSTYHRMARMCMISNESLSFEDTLIDIYDHFKFIVHIKAYFDVNKKRIVRYVESLGTNVDNSYYEIYHYPDVFNKIPIFLKSDFNLSTKDWKDLINQIPKKEVKNG